MSGREGALQVFSTWCGLLGKIEHRRARSLLANNTFSPISIGSADYNLNRACSVEFEPIILQKARIRIVRLGKLNSKGLEGSGLLTIVCVVAEKNPESFGQGSGAVSGRCYRLDRVGCVRSRYE